VVILNFPRNGTSSQIPDQVASVDIDFAVTDDIEIASVILRLNGSEIASYTEFLDYRIVREVFTFDQVTNGDHELEVIAEDLAGNVTTEAVRFSKVAPYETKYRGEMLYIPFEGEYLDKVSQTTPTIIGSPGYAGEGKVGDSYMGAENAYLSFPTDDFSSGQEFSAVFWMKLNAVPDRAGILVASAVDEANPGSPNNRNFGFRFFREDAQGLQRFKLNVGSGSTDSWWDGGNNADVDPTTGEWVHFAISIDQESAAVYIDGNVVSDGSFAGIDWTGVEQFSVMSGDPNFTGWSHFSDESFMDELRFFNVALTQSEIQEIISDESK
jgi:hypothetical protein